MNTILRGGMATSGDDERMILEAIDKWLDRDVKPHVLRLDHADEYPHEMVEQM
jgi:alkylation response protein AidB-like acyl-CoA dehydrogenase